MKTRAHVIRRSLAASISVFDGKGSFVAETLAQPARDKLTSAAAMAPRAPARALPHTNAVMSVLPNQPRNRNDLNSLRESLQRHASIASVHVLRTMPDKSLEHRFLRALGVSTDCDDVVTPSVVRVFAMSASDLQAEPAHPSRNVLRNDLCRRLLRISIAAGGVIKQRAGTSRANEVEEPAFDEVRVKWHSPFRADVLTEPPQR